MSDTQNVSARKTVDVRSSSTSRRAFLGTAAAVAGGAVLGLPRPLSGSGVRQDMDPGPGKDPADFIAHSGLTFETRRGAFGTSAIVPASLLFVRNNLPTPDPSFVEDRDAWELSVEGTSDARVVTLRELKELGVETVATVLQCSGNGRRFFEHETSGSQWGVGAAGCVIWSGVPVRAVIERLGGADPGGRFLTGTGGEVLPENLDPLGAVVERSIPLEKGMDDTLLAWEMNGEPLPLAHGGPLRLVVPGYFGINQVKYVNRLAVTADESPASIQQTSYRVRPIGVSGAPDQPSMWEMSVKSWINHPSGEEGASSGRLIVHGVAFGGTRRVRRVEVSTDGGASWTEAPLVGPDLGPYAWRQFALQVTLPPGRHVLASRATDEAGNTQPADRIENERGYGNTSWRDHAVTLEVA